MEYLQCSLSGGVNRFWSEGKNYTHAYTNWYYRAEVMAQYKKWIAAFSMYNCRNSFWGERMSSGENLHMLSVLYKHKQIAVGVGLVNPFADNYKRIKEHWNRWTSSVQELVINESSRAFFLTFCLEFPVWAELSECWKEDLEPRYG